MAHNQRHGIEPASVRRGDQETLQLYTRGAGEAASLRVAEGDGPDATARLIEDLREEMLEASRALEFERAALLRDQIAKLEKEGR